MVCNPRSTLKGFLQKNSPNYLRKLMKRLTAITGICAALVLPAMAGPKGEGDGEKGKPGGDAAGTRPNPEEIFGKLDADKSGGVSLEEYKASPMAKKATDPSMVEKRFGAMDANSDGNLTKEEFAAAMKKGRPGGKGARPEGAKPRPKSDS